MARLSPDRRQRGFLSVLAAAVLLLASHGAHTGEAREEIRVSFGSVKGNFNAGTMSLTPVEIRQGEGTRITAEGGEVSGFAETYDNTTWTFTGKVHVEYDGAVMDAESAVAVFRDGRLMSVKVDGAPATFSHQFKGKGSRYNGSSNSIEYNTTSGDVLFQPPTRVSRGSFESLSPQAILYNTNTTVIESLGAVREDLRGTMSISPDELKRVPPPRDLPRELAR